MGCNKEIGKKREAGHDLYSGNQERKYREINVPGNVGGYNSLLGGAASN